MFCVGGEGIPVCTGEKNLWIPSRLVKIRFDGCGDPEDLGCRYEGESQERLQDR